MTNLTRQQVLLIATALKHAKQGVTQPEFAKDHCREIVELLQQIEEKSVVNEAAK
jgi:hypothetical protein